MANKKKTNPGSSAPGNQPSGEWREVLLGIPGYDPIATAEDGDWFDEDSARLACDFFPECLQHIEGAVSGKPFNLEGWQRSIIANLFGWKRLDEHGRAVRRYRKCFLFVSRKNGKTPLASGIGLYLLFCDNEPGAQIYVAAGDRDQASLLYRHAKGMIEREPFLSERSKVYAGTGHKSIQLTSDPASVFKVLSADADTKHGGNTHAVIIDELHVQPNRDLVDVLSTSMASANRKQPLMLLITTAGFDRHSICYEEYDYAKKVRDGAEGFEDSRYLPVIYETLESEDWTSVDAWKKSNPNLGVSVSLSYLKDECSRAKDNPSIENRFRRLHLNQWTEQDVRWIPMDQWNRCVGGSDEMYGCQCWCGLDIGATRDLTALVMAFPLANEKVRILSHFWAPRSGAERRERQDRVPYLTWARSGLLELTDGDTVDYAAIRRRIVEYATKYQFVELAVDRLFQGAQLCTELMEDGLPVIEHGQGFLGMVVPTKEFERLIFGGLLEHGNHPILKWMAGNVVVEQDPAGNIKPNKRKSAERIDGIVAAIMAVGRLAVKSESGSVYESRGVTFV